MFFLYTIIANKLHNIFGNFAKSNFSSKSTGLRPHFRRLRLNFLKITLNSGFNIFLNLILVIYTSNTNQWFLKVN